MQLFPFPACWEKGIPQLTLKGNETKWYMTLGHSNPIIGNPQNLFSTGKFPLFQNPDAVFPFLACTLSAGPRGQPLPARGARGAAARFRMERRKRKQ